MDGLEIKLTDLERMSLDGREAEAVPMAANVIRELEAAGADAWHLARARITEAVVLYADDQSAEAIAIWQGIATAYGDSGDPEMRRLAAIAQFNIANGFMCAGDAAAADEAMDDLVAKFGEAAADTIEEQATRHAELLGRPLDAVETGALALGTARILTRCARDRVASVTDPAIAELRLAAPSDTGDVLIAQLEQLSTDARVT